ncbi:MAG: hypothetical protein LBU65_11715 [Planctomycetaceae bacterium]|nr:hypothetical protein [Planctomycetaceae bacterium]
MKIALALLVAFVSTVSTVAAETAKAPIAPRFEKADINKDGKLDQAEFEQYLAFLSKMKLKKPVKEVVPLTETEKLYGKHGSYMESAMGFSVVPVKSVTVVSVAPEKQGGCCDGAKTETTVAEKKGGCCGGAKTEETVVEKKGGCCGGGSKTESTAGTSGSCH